MTGISSGRSLRDGEAAIGLGRTLALGAADRDAPPVDPTLDGPGDLSETLGDGEVEEDPGPVHVGGLRRGDAIGRFVMLELLGAGGMGEVFLCYDPELDRRVAVKLLRPLRSGRGDEARGRLLREARAIARLSHPNVVTVHDVAIWEGRVFLAMEYIAGPTLAAWTRDHDGDWAAIVGMYRQAGEGLAAAHRAGLIHRDFKPDNVLVDANGRPRVLDFGIARSVGTATEPSRASVSRIAAVDPAMNLTTTGMLLGTPAYMAPEQLSGLVIDAGTDQFSFCVALWEALYGQRPFAGDSLETLTSNVMHGRLRVPPRDVRVPERIEAALRRGLSIDPAIRFPDMVSLLAALDPGDRRPRRWSLAVGALVVAGGVALWPARSVVVADPSAACTGDAALLAGIWDEPLRTAGAASFSRSAAPRAAESWAQVLRITDDWQTRWLAARAQACADTHQHHRQSPAALDLRLACLDRQTRELGARAQLWADADADVVRRAVESASALPRPETCELVTTPGADAPSDAVAARIEAVREALARVRALTAAGKYDAAVTLASEQQETTSRLAHPATRAEVALTLARALELAGEPLPARTAFHAAMRLSLEAGADETALAAATGLAAVVGISLSHYDEGEGWLQVAEGLAARVPEGSEHIRLARVSCSFLNDRGLLEPARPHCERAVRLAETLYGPDSLEAASSLLGVGNNHLMARRPSAGREVLARSWQIHTALLGDRHPSLIRLANSRAAAESIAGDLDAAIARWEEGLAIAEASVGGDHLMAGLIHINLSHAALEKRDWERAARELAELERIYLPIQGQVSSPMVHIHFVRGRLALAKGDLARAREQFEQQLHFARETRSPDHPDVLQATLELGDVLARMGEPAASEQRHREALALAEKLADPDATALALRGLCRARVLQGRAVDAIAVGERAMPLAAAMLRGELLRGEVKAWLARALIESGQDAPRGATLEAEARAELQTLTEPGREILAQLDAWTRRAG